MLESFSQHHQSGQQGAHKNGILGDKIGGHQKELIRTSEGSLEKCYNLPRDDLHDPLICKF